MSRADVSASWNTREETGRCLDSLPDGVTDGLPVLADHLVKRLAGRPVPPGLGDLRAVGPSLWRTTPPNALPGAHDTYREASDG